MNTKEIEKKWQEYWEKNKTFKTDVYDFSKPKFYCLGMFPYPSGVGIHAGHPEGYTATDVVSRMKRMQGYNVLHPMGFDSFGLPAEQYAIQTGNHPSGFTSKNIETFIKQLKMCGFSYDWDRMVSTCDPSYYKWTQWIFKNLYEDGYAKYIDMPVNWCEELGTVLANDEIIDGKSERGGYPVVRKNMKQWVIDIPKYAQRLLNGLDEIDWPNSTKEIQRNWIGKSIGAEVTFKVSNMDYSFNVFTTRCDTLFGATYCVLSPEHELVGKITTDSQKEYVKEYKELCATKSELERTELNKEKTGIFTGSYAINPVNNKKVPIWIADYVLSNYGTGAIMAVPAHDERDYEFAKKFGIEIIEVLEGGDIEKEPFLEDGPHVNSEFLNGLNKEEAIEKMISWLEEHKCGKKQISYRLREWIFARQRYWGEPIPIIHLGNGKDIGLKDDELPLVLPELENYSPSKTGESPLERNKNWVDVVVDGVKGKRETATMPGSAGSSWYFLRYIDPHNDKCFADKKLVDHWMPVDLYIGGAEHSVGHLLYARMWNNYLYDKGLVKVKEPFKKLFHQGMILGSNGIKMGKRFPEFVINPNDIIEEYGADTLRLFEMFVGPLEIDKAWNNDLVQSSRKFIERIYRLYTEENKIKEEENKNLEKIYHQTVKKITNDYESLNINTAVSQMMIFVNAVFKENIFPKKYAEGFIKLINPLIPHISEELWQLLGHDKTIAYEPWPTYEEEKIKEETFTIGIQINGKLRSTIEINPDMNEEEILNKSKQQENIKKHLTDHEIIKEIVIKNKIVNFVIR